MPGLEWRGMLCFLLGRKSAPVAGATVYFLLLVRKAEVLKRTREQQTNPSSFNHQMATDIVEQPWFRCNKRKKWNGTGRSNLLDPITKTLTELGPFSLCCL